MQIRIHYNRHNKDLPWSVHTYNGCFACSHVNIACASETESQPNKKENPRYFILIRDGEFLIKDGVGYVGSRS